MALLNILRYPDARLHKLAVPVTVFDDQLKQLVADMAQTMYEAPGIGLAATQVDVHKQLIVIDVSERRDSLVVLINPEIVDASGVSDIEEGCLSVPDMRGVVPRFTSVRLECLDREGTPVDLVAKDFFARVIQHETDHLHGRVYLDRMRDLSTLTHLAEWNRYWLGNQEQDD